VSGAAASPLRLDLALVHGGRKRVAVPHDGLAPQHTPRLLRIVGIRYEACDDTATLRDPNFLPLRSPVNQRETLCFESLALTFT
jgi:hypothetical protein